MPPAVAAAAATQSRATSTTGDGTASGDAEIGVNAPASPLPQERGGAMHQLLEPGPAVGDPGTDRPAESTPESAGEMEPDSSTGKVVPAVGESGPIARGPKGGTRDCAGTVAVRWRDWAIDIFRR